MKYSRGRLIALAILSVTVALSLFGAGLLYNFRDAFFGAAADTDITSYYKPKSFDELYQRILFDKADTGSIELGQGTKLTLLEESYDVGKLKDFLNLNLARSNKRSYRDLQSEHRMDKNPVYPDDKKTEREYRYPLYSSTDMRSIANGMGDSLEIPVVMLDPYKYDDIVLFELTDLVEMPMSLTIKRDTIEYIDGVNLHRVSDNLTSDQVYYGVPKYSLMPMTGEVHDPDDGHLLLYVMFEPKAGTTSDYEVKIRDAGNQPLYIENAEHEKVEATTIDNGLSELYLKNENTIKYKVVRDGKKVTVYRGQDNPSGSPRPVPLGEFEYNKKNEQNEYANQETSYEIGAVAYNSHAVRGMFREQGFYEIAFKQKIATGDGIFTKDVSFAFIIVNKVNYKNSFPRFDLNNRVTGSGEIYNYSYESEYPVVNYSKLLFDVDVITSAEYDPGNIGDNRILKFYNIGKYQMVSGLQFYSEILTAWTRNKLLEKFKSELKSDEKGNAKLAEIEQQYENQNNELDQEEIENLVEKYSFRGVKFDGCITLKRYTKYSSTLNILGFQAYYGGQHDNSRYNGPLPFYDSNDASLSSDISSWVRAENRTFDKSGDIVSNVNSSATNLLVSDALRYSNELANYITLVGKQPVRTNFPPVKLKGSDEIKYATGRGTNGEQNVILSTVAYRPSFGTGHTAEWTSRTLEVGAPFEDAGEYLVTVYFMVNGELCQQTFYFEIINCANIAFEVTANGVTETRYAGELELNQDLCVTGNQVRLSYNGNTTVSQFEVLPIISLAYADFGNYTYSDLVIPMGTDGAFAFSLEPGQYRLTVKYGAHSKSSTVFNIIVDDKLATGIKADTKAKSLANLDLNLSAELPENVAIVGPGEVTLSWDAKLSGIKYVDVLCEFYEMTVENSSRGPNPNTNYDKFPLSVVNLYSATTFARNVSNPSNGYHLEQAEKDGRWNLKEKFVNPGLYRFIIVDEVGNETPFVLIIDNSSPSFIQSGDKPITISNMVNLDDDGGVKIGFGQRKLIKQQNNATFAGNLYTEIFTGLSNAGILANSAINIPLARVERSDSGESYYDIYNLADSNLASNTDFQNGYVLLNEEGTYYFRTTDVLGNTGEYYIILTYDNCFGTIYADSKAPTISADAKYEGRGVISDDPDANTSIVNGTGGMTNRPYVTFSFNQKGVNDGQTFRVKEVTLQYYPLTYQLKSEINPSESNPNYPFAERPKNNPKQNNASNGKELFANQDYNGVIYAYDEDKDSAGGTIRLALFNEGTTTPSGMYIITRTYYSKSGSDTYSRDYYFIVDNQKMLYYDYEENREYGFKSALNIHFAEPASLQRPKAKDADAKIIYESDNELSSNRTAHVNGYASKYSWGKPDGSSTYEIKYFNHLAFRENNQNEHTHYFKFPSLTPRFSYVNNQQTIVLGEGSNTWAIGDEASRTDSSVYDLIIADNARSISCMLINGNIYEIKNPDAPTSANYSKLRLNLDTGCGTKARVISGSKNIEINQMEVDDQDNYVYVIDSDLNKLNNLQFAFKNEPTSMYADIDLVRFVFTGDNDNLATTVKLASALSMPYDESVQVGEEQQLYLQKSLEGWYTFDLLDDFLSTVSITDGASLSISIKTYDDTTTNYVLLFDRYNPEYNLRRIKNNDNLACTMSETDLNNVTGGCGYIYGLSNDFVFETNKNQNHYLDTKEIWYNEADSSGVETKERVFFKLYTGAVGEARVPFANLVGLRDNEMKYFVITEVDYAGHKTEYRVQIKGENFVNAISFIGATSEEGADTQIGIEMHASSASVHQFFAHNNSFKFTSGNDFYQVLGSEASWRIGDNVGVGVSSEAALIDALNTWINSATEKGIKCSYTLYDRIGDVEIFEFYNLRETAMQMQLDCYKPSISSNRISLEVANLDKLPRIMLDDKLAEFYKMSVEEVKEVKEETNGKEVRYRKTSELIYEGNFSLYGTDVPYVGTNDLVIKVTDPFGRVSITEYHQQAQGTIDFTTYGNTVIQDNIIYIGDERGVEFSYLRTVYNVLFYDATTDTLLNGLQSFVSNDVIKYTFKPKLGTGLIEKYRIIATGRASGAVLFDQTFAFDTRLPNVEWTNASDQVLETVDGQSFISSIKFDISKSTIPTIFPVTISYTRKINNHIESRTLKPGIERYTFYQEGSYVITFRNTVWAEQTYEFDIVKIDDTLVLVYDDGKQVRASESGYKYKVDGVDTYISRYIFTTEINSDTGLPYAITDYQANGLEIVVGQTNRVLAGSSVDVDYYEFDALNNTLIWRLAFKVGDYNGIPTYTNPIYFATTGVTNRSLNDANQNGQTKISLRLNGNPENLTGGASTRYDLNPANAYNFIYNDYFKNRDGKLTVELYYNDNWRDEAGAPCWLAKGNLILVDCYYNGILVQTLGYHDSRSDVFTINQNEAGYYEFVVHDLVGNYLYFGDSDNENDINYRQERYRLVVMTAPIVLINNQLPMVDDMIYNDRVELRVNDYGSEFLSKYYELLAKNPSFEKNDKFFEAYFCVTKIEGTYTGKNKTDVINLIPNPGQSTFPWTQSGYYRIKLTYRIYNPNANNDALSSELTADYSFRIIPSNVQETFSMPVYPDAQIVAITRDGYPINDYDDANVLSFDANHNPGSYVVTLRTYSSILRNTVYHEIHFNIQHKTNSASTYFILSCASGQSVTGSVSVYCNPYWLYLAQGDVTISLYKDFELQKEVKIDRNILNGNVYNSQEMFNVSDAGLYTVRVCDAEGDNVYSDSWTIEEEQSTFGYIILAVVLGIAGIGILVFVRLRRKMTTK